MIIEDTTQDQDKSCGICQIQTARYTCPRCNLHYCSLTCYRGDEHNACSEGFYKEQLVTELKNTHSSQHERDRMLSFLQKIEQDAVDDDYNDNETNHDASSIADLATRLADMNLDTASFDTIWNCLTDKERHDFERIIHNDSEERSVLLKQLDIYHPWWNTQKRQRIIIEDEDHETIMTRIREQ
ncbi:hypothetical protein BDF22DRAFT_739906 [Syncephalis plumigaleata]|nr:hypothetical protein BDF22DRAFT_739906 [Syncephalis plumigaleata]